jgi:hypothetical protein
MSALSAAAGAGALSGTGLPVIDQSTEPASVRNGDQTAKNAYQTGMAFEQMLVNELSQQLTATVSGTGSSDDGLGGTTDDGTGDDSSSASADPAVGAYSSLLPDALTSGVMSTGGTGIAMQIAQAIDPALAGDGGTGTAGASGSGAPIPSGGAALTDPYSTTTGGV